MRHRCHLLQIRGSLTSLKFMIQLSKLIVKKLIIRLPLANNRTLRYWPLSYLILIYILLYKAKTQDLAENVNTGAEISTSCGLSDVRGLDGLKINLYFNPVFSNKNF